jgi:D-aminopeptidase
MNTHQERLRPRARDIGIQIGEIPTGPHNTITDVPGLKVGHISLTNNEKNIHTGVSAIIPHEGNLLIDKVCAAVHVINGFGKSIGFPQVTELGSIETPILLTNTLNTWTVADALVDYVLEQNPTARTINPIVGECNDGHLNNIAGRHVKKRHVTQALRNATSPNNEEGCVGAGVGTQCFSWKGGIGTASRLVHHNDQTYSVGVLTQTNTGRCRALRIDGVPIGRELKPDYLPATPAGSIMFVVATDAPFTARQLTRIAKRVALGLARIGGEADHGSGDFVIAFTTGNRISQLGHQSAAQFIPESEINPFFHATIEATEEAILNALLRATTTTGRDGHSLSAIPIDSVVEIMKKYGRLTNG